MQITTDIIEALRTLRAGNACTHELEDAFSVLDAAGLFTAVDEAADREDTRAVMAVAPAVETIQCGHCWGDYKPMKNGGIRKHNCWKYDSAAGTVVYGELDARKRGEAARLIASM
jgi:hypothetical protein